MLNKYILYNVLYIITIFNLQNQQILLDMVDILYQFIWDVMLKPQMMMKIVY